MSNITQQIFISRKKIFFSRFSIVPAGKFSNFRKKKCCYAVNIYPGIVSDSAGNLHNNRVQYIKGGETFFLLSLFQSLIFRRVPQPGAASSFRGLTAGLFAYGSFSAVMLQFLHTP